MGAEGIQHLIENSLNCLFSQAFYHNQYEQITNKTRTHQMKHCYHISVPHFVARFAALFAFCGAIGGELWSSCDGWWW
mgnify:CR=1 FL=1